MPYNSNDRLEREARESLVASDLSAKMKQWRDNPAPPDKGGGGPPIFKILFVLLVAGGVAWLFWPREEKRNLPTPTLQVTPASDEAPVKGPQISDETTPIAKNTPQNQNRYLALVQTRYAPPDFTAEIRGDQSAVGTDLLGEVRKALAAHRYSDAYDMLENAPPQFKTDASYLRAHALFGMKKYARAAEIFGQLGNSIRYGEAAEWFGALSLLAETEQNKPRVLKMLQNMAQDEGHTFHREAKSLLKAL